MNVIAISLGLDSLWKKNIRYLFAKNIFKATEKNTQCFHRFQTISELKGRSGKYLNPINDDPPSNRKSVES